MCIEIINPCFFQVALLFAALRSMVGWRGYASVNIWACALFYPALCRGTEFQYRDRGTDRIRVDSGTVVDQDAYSLFLINFPKEPRMHGEIFPNCTTRSNFSELNGCGVIATFTGTERADGFKRLISGFVSEPSFICKNLSSFNSEYKSIEDLATQQIRFELFGKKRLVFRQHVLKWTSKDGFLEFGENATPLNSSCCRGEHRVGIKYVSPLIAASRIPNRSRKGSEEGWPDLYLAEISSDRDKFSGFSIKTGKPQLSVSAYDKAVAELSQNNDRSSTRHRVRTNNCNDQLQYLRFHDDSIGWTYDEQGYQVSSLVYTDIDVSCDGTIWYHLAGRKCAANLPKYKPKKLNPVVP